MLDFLSVPEDSGSGFGFSRIWFFCFSIWILDQTGIKNSWQLFKKTEQNNPIFFGRISWTGIVIQQLKSRISTQVPGCD
jgi:hypothetical protein